MRTLTRIGLATIAVVAASEPAWAFRGFYVQSREAAPFESLAERGLDFEEIPCGNRDPELALPFDVEMFGGLLEEVEVRRSGWLSVYGDRNGSVRAGSGSIAPFASDLEAAHGRACAKIRHVTTGQAPHRVFWVELSDFRWRSDQSIRSAGAFQVLFFEGAPGFEVHYGGRLEWRRENRPPPDTRAYWRSHQSPPEPRGDFAPCSVTADCDVADFTDDLLDYRFRVEKAVAPELRPVAFELDPGARPGERAEARVTVENNGEETAVGLDVALYASTDAAVTPVADRRLVLARDLLVLEPLGTRRTVTLPFDVPADLAADERFHVYAAVDPTDQFEELDEADNTWSNDVPNFATGLDLEVSGCRVTAPPPDGSPGAPIGFEVEIANAGVPYAGEVDVELWAAEGSVLDPGRDIALGRFTVGPLAERPRAAFTLNTEVPPDGLEVGGYFPACVADPDDVVPEVEGGELNRRTGGAETRFWVAPARLDIMPDASLPDAHLSAPYEYEVQFGGGGFTREQVSFTAEGLPTGLEITPRGLIRGEARELTAPEGRSFVVEAQAGGDIDRERFSIRVLPPEPLVFAPAELPAATRGREYEAKLEATGGAGTRIFRLAGGVLPGGLELSGDGSIRGIPVELGTFEIEIVVADTPPRDVAMQEQSQTLELVVVDEALTFDRTSIPPAQSGRRYDARIEVRTTTPPLSWSYRAEPELPAGMAMGPAPNGTLFWIRGVPEAAGSVEVQIEVEDASGRRGERSFELFIEPAPESDAQVPTYTPGGGCASLPPSAPGALGALLIGLWALGPRRRRERRERR